MRLLSKAEASRELGLSLSTLDRRIAAGELQAKREPRGRRHRVYVMLDDEPPGNGKATDSALVAARERVRELKEQVAFLQGQLELEQQRKADLVNDVKTGALDGTGHRPWWRWW